MNGCKLLILSLIFSRNLIFVITNLSSGDPYRALGLQRGATIQEVKKAYKNLAKEWHPDKNQSPEAEGKFIEISEAYEYLSDPKKKEHFDRYGTVEQESRGGFGAPPDMAHHFFHRGFFEEFGFRMPEPSELFRKFSITAQQLESQIFPESSHRPWLIYAYSDWCHQCKLLEPLWDKIAAEVGSLGYGLGTVNNVYQGSMIRRLKVRRLPTIVAVVDGRLHHFSGSFEFAEVVKFCKRVLPSHITELINDDNFDVFLDGWRHSGKVPMLMFGAQSQPRLRYLLLAFRYQAYASFGYSKLNQHDRQLRERLGRAVANGSETLAIFNEVADWPKAVISNRGELSSEQLSGAIERNKWLILPRISSQSIFDELCPPKSGHHLCAILLVHKSSLPSIIYDSGDQEHIDRYREYVTSVEDRSSTLFGNDRAVRFAFLYSNKQVDFVGTLKTASTIGNDISSTTTATTSTPSMTNDSYRQLLIAKRIDRQQMKYAWLPGGWSGEPQLVNRCAEALTEQLQKYLRRSDLLQQKTFLRELNNEHGPNFYRRFAYHSMRMYENFIYHMEREELLPIVSILGTLLVIVFLSWCCNYLVKLEQRDELLQNRQRQQQQQPHQQQQFNNNATTGDQNQRAAESKIPYQHLSTSKVAPPYLIRELRAESYNGLVRSLKPGCRSIVLVCNHDTKDELLPRFTECIWPWRKNATLLFGWLNVEKNLKWYQSLLIATVDEPRLANLNAARCVGTVLCINGFRQYFQIYHAHHAPSMRPYRQKRRQQQAMFLGFENAAVDYDWSEEDDVDADVTTAGTVDRSTSEAADVDMAALKKKERAPSVESDATSGDGGGSRAWLLDGLSNWLERVFEGSIPRYYISTWPDIR